MKKIIHIISLLLMIAFLSCENPVDTSVNLNEEFSLKVGERAVIKSEDLKIKFVAVTEDSRCPSGSLCDWAGNAKVACTAQKNEELPVKDTLNTYLDPRNTWFKAYQISLVKLEPYPQNFEPIPQPNYTATFIIKRYLID